jgi:hypothetical protein
MFCTGIFHFQIQLSIPFSLTRHAAALRHFACGFRLIFLPSAFSVPSVLSGLLRYSPADSALLFFRRRFQRLQFFQNCSGTRLRTLQHEL